ncbi:hypothetical protein JD844_009898 [Phrynosoma platyrhinos]|uniref:Ig-like domain-containing protein n=1 Tax=Phrynosoma platyrhinos TaxID=52577 RepID=A0ABQ7TFP2_PHRPL|nr:hypothetical protein JD844_009898 [Phrynosoma platyrhinos]
MTVLLLFWMVAFNLQLTTAVRNISCATRVETRVWAKEGGQALLPCYLSAQKLESTWRQLYKGLTVRWVQHGGRSHKKRHLVLKVEPSGLKKWSRSMMHRVAIWDIGFLSGNFSLQIDPLMNDDAGIYEALVKYGSNVWCCRLELGVVSVTVDPPSPLVESEPTRLTCNCTHPEKPTKIRWFHAGLLIPTTGRFIYLDQSLFISRLVGSDSGPWVCELIFADGERISATYNLRVIGFAEKIVPVIYTAAGSDAQLPCILNHNPLDYGISNMSVYWNYMERRGVKTFTYGNGRDFTLHLPAVGSADAGQYLCEITIQGTTITQNVILAVMTVIVSSEETAITEGSYLLFTCSLSYHAGHERFQWRKLGFKPPNNASRSEELLGPTLEFSPVSLNDAGTWECQVYGPEGMLGSVQHHLAITGTLHFFPTEIYDLTFKSYYHIT